MNKRKYQEYLRTPHWREIRTDKLIKARWVCEECKRGEYGIQLDVHHLTYDRIGNERMSDLKVLCHDCHEKVHENGFVPKKTMSDKEIENEIEKIEREIREAR